VSYLRCFTGTANSFSQWMTDLCEDQIWILTMSFLVFLTTFKPYVSIYTGKSASKR